MLHNVASLTVVIYDCNKSIVEAKTFGRVGIFFLKKEKIFEICCTSQFPFRKIDICYKSCFWQSAILCSIKFERPEQSGHTFRPDVSAQQKFKRFLRLLFWDNRPCMYTLLCLHVVIITAIAEADYVTIIAVVILFFGFEFPGIFDTPLDQMFRPNKNSNASCGCNFDITGLVCMHCSWLHPAIDTALADADYVTIIAVIILLFCFELPGMFIILTHLYTKCFGPTKIKCLLRLLFCSCYTGLYVCTAVIACCHDNCFCWCWLCNYNCCHYTSFLFWVARDIYNIDTPLDQMFRSNKNSNACCNCYFGITGFACIHCYDCMLS